MCLQSLGAHATEVQCVGVQRMVRRVLRQAVAVCARVRVCSGVVVVVVGEQYLAGRALS